MEDKMNDMQKMLQAETEFTNPENIENFEQRAIEKSEQMIADLREATINQMVATVRADKEGKGLRALVDAFEIGEIPLYVLLRVIKEV